MQRITAERLNAAAANSCLARSVITYTRMRLLYVAQQSCGSGFSDVILQAFATSIILYRVWILDLRAISRLPSINSYFSSRESGRYSILSRVQRVTAERSNTTATILIIMLSQRALFVCLVHQINMIRLYVQSSSAFAGPGLGVSSYKSLRHNHSAGPGSWVLEQPLGFPSAAVVDIGSYICTQLITAQRSDSWPP